EGVRLLWDRHRVDALDQAPEWRDEGVGVLRLHHPPDEMNGARHALVELSERMGNGLTACCIVPAIEPNLGPLAHILVERTFAEALKPRRPFGMGQSPLKRVDGERIAESDARGGDSSAGIVDLVPPVE